MLVVIPGVALIFTIVLGRSYSQLALQKEPFDRLSYVPSFDPIEDVTLGLSPNSNNVVVSKPSLSIRAIEVYPTQIILLAGGKAVRTIDSNAPATLHALAGLVDDPGWITESGSTITLQAAVIAEHGSAMTIAAPVTTDVVMAVRPGVFLAAWQGALSFSGVHVRAGDTKVPTTYSTPKQEAGRPFVLAASHSTMTISDSTFRYLGRDWNSSYGISWSKGSTGSVQHSTFEHDFIGVYTNDSDGITVGHSYFAYNSLYGIDPHSGSSHLVIEYNTSDFNGRHGIIFSDHVTHGLVRNNVTSGNGLNGIMMDESSTDNRIVDDTVIDNKSDGIVLANSSHNIVAGNIVRGNRIGINVRGSTTASSIARNTVDGNKLAAEGTALAGNRVYGNGGQWSVDRTELTWLIALAALVVCLGATWFSHGRGTRRRPVHARTTLRAAVQ